MFLIIDCETTGLPRDWNARPDDSKSWPRLVQVAWCLFDAQEQLVESVSHIIRPTGFFIPPDAEFLHGISTARAQAEGIDLEFALSELRFAADRSTVLVAHNLRFDASVLAAEYYRVRQKPPFDYKWRVCTQLESADYCKLPGRYGNYKWPKLAELHRLLFGTEHVECHEAASDVAACARCFFELKHRGVLDLGDGDRSA